MRASGAIALLAVVLLGGCERNGGLPSGQVIAKVGNTEITIADVLVELGPRAAGSTPQLQANAIDTIINRKILVDEAHLRALDKTAQAALIEQRANELAMVEMLEASMREKVPKPTANDIRSFVADNPILFARRKLVDTDHFYAANVPPTFRKKLETLDRWEQIREALDHERIDYRAGSSTIDTATLEPKAAQQIVDLGIDGVFFTPVGRGVRISRIRTLTPEPLEGRRAYDAAAQIILGKRAGDVIGRNLDEILREGRANVTYNPAFRRAAPSGTTAAAAPQRTN